MNHAQAFLVLKNKIIEAAWQARSDAELLSVQRDMVEGARRLEARCRADKVDRHLMGEVTQYRKDTEAALAALERQGQRTLGKRGLLP